MICVVIKGPSLEQAKKQISAALPIADLVELRLDFFETLEICSLKKQFTIPMIFTLRSEKKRSQEERRTALKNLAQLNPEYLDLESSDPPSLIQEIRTSHPNIKIILSHHDFEKTSDPEVIYQNMQTLPAHFYKIVMTAKNSLDTMRLLSWAKEKNVIALNMGPFGQISRILAPLVNNPITYASIESGQESAPGQLPAKILTERYHYASLNGTTALYALIGDPVDKSVSDITHNHLFTTFNLNAVYVKIPVKIEELPEFLTWAKKIGIKGLSVTMPLKEAIVPLLDSIDPEAKKIGAVNTLHFHDGKIFGYNTDGVGALNALEKIISVKNQHIVILGAGGAAKAIAYEAKRRGAFLTIVNRDRAKACHLAKHLDAAVWALEQMPLCAQKGYTILINTTPLSLPIDPINILPGSYVMDINSRPLDTQLLKHAKKKGCTTIEGYKMFVEQALGQYNLWFQDRVSKDLAREILTAKSLTALTTTKV
jgi:3-dehydroquinate dehydratase/shikimate dehydrogenase